MRHLLAVTAVVLVPSGVLAQTGPETVTLTMQVEQPSLFDTSRRDTFRTVIDDRAGTTTLEVVCSAGTSALFGLSRTDEACSVAGSGMIKNPNNPSQSVQRIDYAGGFTIVGAQDGFTDMRTIAANYRRVGSAPQEAATFGGHLVMNPEAPSASALELGRNALAYLQQNAGSNAPVTYDTAIDSIRFQDVRIPHVGHANSVACSWTGDWIYSYAAESWNGAFDITCGNDRYRLEGNMSLQDAPAGSSHQQDYVINLIVPGAAGGGDPFAAPDPFATVDGITGTLSMTNSGRSVDGVYASVAVRGQIVGTNLPLEVVRGWGQIVGVLARSFFGA